MTKEERKKNEGIVEILWTSPTIKKVQRAQLAATIVAATPLAWEPDYRAEHALKIADIIIKRVGL